MFCVILSTVLIELTFWSTLKLDKDYDSQKEQQFGFNIICETKSKKLLN